MADMEAPKVSSGDPPLQADVQDPLPESNWLYRRWFIFVLSTINIIGLWWIGRHVQDHDAAFRWLLLFQWFLITYYLIAPSAEQVVKMIQSASMFKQGVVTTTTATVNSSTGQASSQTTVGKVAAVTSSVPKEFLEATK